MEDEELYNEIIWVMTHYGSNAKELAEPGSKLRSQAKRIVDFVAQRREAQAFLDDHQLDHIKVVSRAPKWPTE